MPPLRSFSRMQGWGLILLLCTGLWSATLQAAEIRVAVAANFAGAATALQQAFAQRTGHSLVLIVGSTGKHYAQIINGAPYDVLLAADSERPRRLAEAGHADTDSRQTYALGVLALWSPADREGSIETVLNDAGIRRIAIANPRLAPYGYAAQQTLTALGHWDTVQKQLVRGENIAQAFQFVASGNAQLGFIAASQLSGAYANTGTHWIIPAELYTPIEQQVVLLSDAPAAAEFVAFLQSDEARRIIRSYHYGLPGHP